MPLFLKDAAGQAESPVVTSDVKVEGLDDNAFLQCVLKWTRKQQVHIYMKQSHPVDMQQALAKAMEFKAFLYTGGGGQNLSHVNPTHHCGTPTTAVTSQ
ncbi:hypothetical protein E2C01_035856 [Portunus trituberculatus]|uniref:Uncharacterized protein n=1 Tax=Portunus trituberculatus TaxID=210409 RepID=A0A5B7FAF6_PORTR|nr:hypothetical protein [Portunus trituberculatus]